LATFAWISA